MSFLQTLLAFVVALGVLIVVHEYGHYVVARLCGVKVLRFSVGFGRPLAVWRLGADRTEWVIAAVPFGGYVKMLDEREGPVAPHEAQRAFNRKSVWRRILIVVAGPLFNFIFAIVVYAGLFMYGLPEARPVLGAPPAGTLAAAAGIAAGDTVRSVVEVTLVRNTEIAPLIQSDTLYHNTVAVAHMGLLNQSRAVNLNAMAFSGGQAGMHATGALIYPTAVRANGVGLGLLVTRFAGVVAPKITGILFTSDRAVTLVLWAAALPLLIVSACYVGLARLNTRATLT